MPMLSKTEVGMVIAIWGQAWVRGADGMFRALKLGETLHKGTVVLTAQDAIVQIASEGVGDDRTSVVAASNKTQPTPDADRAIEGINKGDADAAPAAGLSGGDGGDLQPGLRVDRIVELTQAARCCAAWSNPDAIGPREWLAARSGPGDQHRQRAHVDDRRGRRRA
jgi:hypothetical protein